MRHKRKRIMAKRIRDKDTVVKKAIREMLSAGAKRACATSIRAMATAISAVDNSSTLLETALVTVTKAFSGRTLETNEIEFVANGIAADRDWPEKTAKVRKSEIRKILRVVDILPAAIAAYRKQHAVHACGYHAAVKLARELGNWDGTKAQRIEAAVSMAFQVKTVSDPATLANGKAKAEVAKLVARIHKFKKVAGAFHGALDDLCEEHGIS